MKQNKPGIPMWGEILIGVIIVSAFLAGVWTGNQGVNFPVF